MPLAMRWPTAACTVRAVSRPPRAAEARRTAPTSLERMRPVAPPLTARQRASTLNRAAAHAGLGGACTASQVAGVR